MCWKDDRMQERKCWKSRDTWFSVQWHSAAIEIMTSDREDYKNEDTGKIPLMMKTGI